MTFSTRTIIVGCGLPLLGGWRVLHFPESINLLNNKTKASKKNNPNKNLMQTNATLNQKKMSERYLENSLLVFVNSFYSAGYPHASNARATCQKTEIRLLKNRQCTYYQNGPEFSGDLSGTENWSHHGLQRGTWILKQMEENQLELTIVFSDGASRSFTIHINHQGYLFLNGKRFQISKIKS